ncbi:hypothetical protein A4A49_15799 [Nicotiana attenuata]|uniref:Uncharacterized protein n=1 Tax=Nicotiana attenuata TaxID=49451 RepID=A0A314LF79_NICAT|nr:hypothetical protein A4A49_15799 [Nicotiana attenuata]
MNSKGEAAGVYVDLEAGQPGKGSDQTEPQNTNLISTGTGQNTLAQGQKIAVVSSIATVPVSEALARVSTELNSITVTVSDRASAGVTKGPGDRQKSDEVGHQIVNAHVLMSVGQAGAILENKTDGQGQSNLQLVSAEQQRRSEADQPAATLGKLAGKLAGVNGETDAKRAGDENIVQFYGIAHNDVVPVYAIDGKELKQAMIPRNITGKTNGQEKGAKVCSVVSPSKKASTDHTKQEFAAEHIRCANSFDALVVEQDHGENDDGTVRTGMW